MGTLVPLERGDLESKAMSVLRLFLWNWPNQLQEGNGKKKHIMIQLMLSHVLHGSKQAELGCFPHGKCNILSTSLSNIWKYLLNLGLCESLKQNLQTLDP